MAKTKSFVPIKMIHELSPSVLHMISTYMQQYATYFYFYFMYIRSDFAMLGPFTVPFLHKRKSHQFEPYPCYGRKNG